MTKTSLRCYQIPIAFYFYRFFIIPISWFLLRLGRWLLPAKLRETVRLKNEKIFYRSNRACPQSPNSSRLALLTHDFVDPPQFSVWLNLRRLASSRVKTTSPGRVWTLRTRPNTIECDEKVQPPPAGSPSFIIWIHAASGEIEYARPVLREIKKKLPNALTLVTFTSPGAGQILKGISEIDFWGPAPWDAPWSVRSFLDYWNPVAALFSRTDVWPEMALQCYQRGIPTLLFAATFAKASSRLRGMSLSINKFCFSLLSQIHCVSTEDVEILRKSMPSITMSALAVTGDTRYDQVTYRINHPKFLPKNLMEFWTGIQEPSKVFVMGSTWIEDERILFPLLPELKKQGWKFILAPHEIPSSRLEALKENFQQMNLNYTCLSNFSAMRTSHSHDILLVDQIGYLAELYTFGNIAFVGGSFRKQVHSVMEPLAAGLPVIVGPHHQNNREAVEFQNIHVEAPKISIVTVVNNSEEISSFFANMGKHLELEGRSNSWHQLRGLICQQVRLREGATLHVLEWLKKNLPINVTMP